MYTWPFDMLIMRNKMATIFNMLIKRNNMATVFPHGL